MGSYGLGWEEDLASETKSNNRIADVLKSELEGDVLVGSTKIDLEEGDEHGEEWKKWNTNCRRRSLHERN